MIQITQSGFVGSLSQSELDALRSQFQQHHFVHLRGLFELTLLHLIQDQLENAEFEERHTETNLFESYMTDKKILGALLFLTNNPGLFEVVQQITGCSNITSFFGRVYRKIPGLGHFDSWHNDLNPGRIVGMSINLSRQVYLGGSLKIRDAGSKEVLGEVVNTGFGDAILFRLSPLLEHRVEEVHGAAPKMAFAGWFLSGPVFQIGKILK